MTSEAQPFVHLRLHSAYSLLEGALTIQKLAALAKADGAPALALTNSNNLFGALEFSEAVAEAGIQPIVGLTLSLSFLSEGETNPNGEVSRRVDHGRIALLAKDERGYANLMKLTTDAYQHAFEGGDVIVSTTTLFAHQEGLIVLTGGPDGVIDKALAANNLSFAETALNSLKSVFGDRLYVELQRHGLAQERAVEPQLLKLAYDLDLPIVATNEPYFATQEDFEAHDALICIAEGSYVAVDERRRLSPEHYFKTQRANAGAVRRSARGAGEHRGDCAPLRLPAAATPADPPAFPHRRGSLDRSRRDRSGRAQAPVGSRAQGHASPNTAWRLALTPPPMPSGSPSNSMSSPA